MADVSDLGDPLSSSIQDGQQDVNTCVRTQFAQGMKK